MITVASINTAVVAPATMELSVWASTNWEAPKWACRSSPWHRRRQQQVQEVWCQESGGLGALRAASPEGREPVSSRWSCLSLPLVGDETVRHGWYRVKVHFDNDSVAFRAVRRRNGPTSPKGRARSPAPALSPEIA